MNDLEILKKLAFNIKVERMRKGLTQAQLAERIEVHEKYIGKIETGKQNITIKTLSRLADVLEIDACKLLKFD